MEDFKYKDTVYFHIPAIFKSYINSREPNIYTALLSANHEKDLRGDINLIAYGCPANCIWNGGRLIHGYQYTIDDIDYMFSVYETHMGIPLQLTFTNSILEKRDIYDRYGNALLDLANKYEDNVEILVVSDILEKHIRNRYPNLKIARSIIKWNQPTEEDFKKYSTIVVPKRFNRDKDYIKSLLNKGSSIELLVDEPCDPTCSRIKTHYKAYAKTQLFIEHNDCLSCTNISKHFNKFRIYPKEINDYIDLGVNHFKLSGREELSHMLMSIIEYLLPYDKVSCMFSTLLNLLFESRKEF